MINLKLSKKDKKETAKAEVPSIERDDYPYGTRLRFEDESIKKIPFLQKVKAGAMIDIKAIGKVIEVRTVDKDTSKKYENIEIQIQQIDIGSANEAEESFNEKE